MIAKGPKQNNQRARKPKGLNRITKEQENQRAYTGQPKSKKSKGPTHDSQRARKPKGLNRIIKEQENQRVYTG